MARSAASVLVPKPKLADLKSRVPAALLETLEKLEQRLETEAPELEFDRNALVTTALERGVAEATRELDDLSRRAAAGAAK